MGASSTEKITTQPPHAPIFRPKLPGSKGCIADWQSKAEGARADVVFSVGGAPLRSDPCDRGGVTGS